MKPKQPNLLQYMNFSKKNKSTNKSKSKTIIPNYLDSFSNKYPAYLQSSLNEDILLLKKKLKGYSKIYSHSSNNTNKNIEVSKKPPITSNINSISPISPISNYFLKKKNNICVNKSIKNNLMLTSINNMNNNSSSVIYTSKDKDKFYNNNNKMMFKNNNNTNSSYRGINNNNINYNINYNKNMNNIYNNNNQIENDLSKKIKLNNNNGYKKYSMTSVSSRKASKEREKIKNPDDINNINNINNLGTNKINFNGLFNNYNYNNNNINHYLSKNMKNNYINNSNSNNSNRIIYENNYIKNNNNNNSNANKKLFMGDFSNLKKGKLLNDFLENYLKVGQNNKSRKMKSNTNNYNMNKSSNKNISSTANTSLTKNNNYFPPSSSHYSPNNGNELYKTAKISPRSSFPKKTQEFIQSHRVNVKNKLQGNIFAFYNNYNNNTKNNNNRDIMFNNNSNLNIDNNNISNNQFYKKKKSNMSVNMNITYNNKNFNMSNLEKNKNKSMMNNEYIIDTNINQNLNNKTSKSNSLNKINNINYIENYNYNCNLINKNNINVHHIHNSSNNSFVNIKKTTNPIMNGKNIINNCKININNINYNNINNNNMNNDQIEQIINEKNDNINFKNKNSIENNNNDKSHNKINSSSQPEITQTKKNKKKNLTTNNSPINKNIDKKNKISNNNSQNNIKINTNINSYSSKNSKKNNNINNLKSKENKKIKYEIKEKPKTNNNSLIFDKNDKNYEILELKHNLQKNNSEIYISSEKNNNKNNQKINGEYILKKKKEFSEKNNSNEKDKEDIINNYANYANKNTISNLSSTTHDSNYYMEKSNSLSKYIRDYYKRYNKYPNTNLNFYLYGRLIGQGAFGKVNIGLNILTGRVVAIKSFNKKSLSSNGDNMKKILSETDLMKKLNHPNVTKILEMFEDEEYILIAMEYINGGNLFSFVKKRRKLSEKTAKFLFRQIILGIKHIHSKKIVHRDIKLENILIDLNNNIKICDFGIGRVLKNEKQMLYDKCGTPMYMAPEILLSSKTKGYEGYPVDIWSSGISLYIMLSGTLPFNLKNNEDSDMSEESNHNNMELQYSIINKEPKKIEKISDEAKDLLKGLLNKNPKKRLTIDQILNHPWLIEENKKNYKNKKYHLFTKAEMIMLSKTYIDYRNGLIEDLKEQFTISNLKLEKNPNLDGNKKILKNITTKSSLLAPYNTLIQNDDSFSEDSIPPSDDFDDLANPNIALENDILIINNKIKEYNLNYELNNNGECDNGMLINTKTETISSKSANNQSQISSRNDNEDMEDNSDENDNEEEYEKKTEKILEEIEKIGYDRKYVMNCVKNNELCHASAIFYLMMNYNDI